jgi:hypothetical protein
MLKWVGRFIYLILVLLASFFVMLTGASNGYSAFIKENMVGEEGNLPVYLKGLSTLEYLDYYQEDPFLSFDQGLNTDVTFKIDMYAVGKTVENDKIDGFFIYVYDVSVKDEENNTVENPSIQIVVTLDKETYKPGNSSVATDEAIVTYYPDQTASLSYMALYDAPGYLEDPENEGVFAQVTEIKILYSLGEKTDNGAYEYLEVPLFIARFDLTNEDPGIVKELGFAFDHSEYRLRSQFGEETPTDAEIETFGLITEQFNLNRYNWYIWRALIIYILVIIVVTYFIFFHKKVMEKRRFKKIDSSTAQTKTANAEPIFKEYEPTEKDGK